MKMLRLLFLLAGLGKVGLGTTLAQQVTVAPDGSGNFRTIQAAVNSLPNEASQLRTVFIKNGTYREKVFVDGKANIVFKGQSEKGVVLTYAQARDAWRCDPAGGPDDWGVATLNLRNSPDITLENLTVINSYGFDAKGDVVLDCPAEPSGKKTVSKTGHQMALRTMPGATRITVKHCTFRALGGDTVSPWDTEAGLYYFKDCTMEGGVDFYCPRGWAYAENCRFICHNPNAAIWHDGSGNRDSKTVLKNCRFTGDDNFKLGRFHREAQFYLIGCKFAKNMADADIYWAESGPGAKQWGRRVYYYDCHRKGGDYAWMKNNLATAENAPSPRAINANWTFGGRWNVDPRKPALPAPASAAVDTIAEKMLVFQRSVGGWPKAVGEVKVNYDHKLTAAQRAATLADKNRTDATIDNNATTREITYLVEAFRRTNNPAYRQAAENGIRFLLKMQYPNGGFPQYYPDFSNYRHQITYNDDAMVRALTVLRNVAQQKDQFAIVDPGLVAQAKEAVDRGVSCILKTQYVQNGKLTAWCAQHDEKTLLPAKARAFELASLSGDETVGIVRFLMGVDKPSEAVKTAIESAVAWLNAVKMEGFAMKEIDAPKEPRGKDRVIVPEAGSTLWARFYELNTNRPIYVGRDSQVHYHLTEIENERRAGYLYAGTWPAKLLEKEYPAWQKRVNTAPGEAKK
ncbi:pectate lyase [Hymenobacter sp. BT770]|nr:pectate lyase [Hymenobacter sp. BT770]